MARPKSAVAPRKIRRRVEIDSESMATRRPCKRCGAEALESTLERNRGLCAPCRKDTIFSRLSFGVGYVALEVIELIAIPFFVIGDWLSQVLKKLGLRSEDVEDDREQERPPMNANLKPDGWVKCPFCRKQFSTADDAVWRGDMHLTCGTKLILLSPAADTN